MLTIIRDSNGSNISIGSIFSNISNDSIFGNISNGGIAFAAPMRGSCDSLMGITISGP